MSNEILTADAAAGDGNLPVRKRKAEGFSSDSLAAGEAKIPPTSDTASAAASGAEGDEDGGMKPLKRGSVSKAREIRLEQNRKAARESRRRKKSMIDELQRSVIFFSRANSTLKQQNDELTRLLVQAQTQVNEIESGQQPTAASATLQPEQQHVQGQGDQHQKAQAVAQQAVYESQGFSSTAARTAAQTMNAVGYETASAASDGTPAPASHPSLPSMQTGATMQAMANFQQAAAAAMANAMAMAGMNTQVVPTALNASQQQVYTDAMNAMVMQQAVAAAAGGQAFPFLQQMQPNMFPGLQFPVAVSQPAMGQPAPADATQQQQQQVQPQEQATTEPQG